MSNVQPHTKVINSLRKCFTKIPNALAVDLYLSSGAVRVFLYMSCKPDDWFFNNRDIQKQLGIKDVWFQPGAASDGAVSFCKINDINYINDACIMVEKKNLS